MTLLQRLARSMHPLCSQQKWFAVKAYFDESGDESNRDCEVMAFASLVAPFDGWDKYFEPKWKARLRKAKLDPNIQCFHASPFHGGQKPFNTYQWKDYSYKKHFFSDLVSIINKTVSYVSIHAVIVKDWRNIIGPSLTKYEREQTRAIYQFLMFSCMADIANWKRRAGIDEKIVCIFDRKNEVQHYARSYFYELIERNSFFGSTYEDAVWKDKQTFIPLQAADLVAYEGYNTTLDIEVKKKSEVRSNFYKIFGVLEKDKRIDISWHTEHELSAWVREAELMLMMHPEGS